MDNQNIPPIHSQTPNTPDSQLDHQPIKHSAIKWIIILILAAILISGGTYLFLKSQSKTANQTGNNSQITQVPTILPAITTITSVDPTANRNIYNGNITDNQTTGKYKLTFKYPPAYEASASSYEVILNKKDNGAEIIGGRQVPIYRLLVISTFDNFYNYRKIDTSQPLNKWFTKMMELTNPNINFGGLTFEEINVSNGKKYIKISNFPNEYPLNLFPERVYYIPIDTAGILITDDKYLSLNVLDNILSSLDITKE